MVEEMRNQRREKDEILEKNFTLSASRSAIRRDRFSAVYRARGDRQVRTMEVDVELLGHKYIQAVEEKSLFGTYYRFFDINHDMAYANFEADMELNVHYTQLQGLKLKDGFAIQLISSDRYQDNYGPPSQTIEGGSTYFSNFSEDGNELVQLFWVEGDELPEGYRLFCRRESLTIGYDMLVGLYHDNEKRK